MAKSRKGGYKLVSLQLIELTTMTACAGLYACIVNSHDKPLMISDIVIDGAKKNNVYCTAIKGTKKYTIKHIYGYNLEVTDEDVVTITEDAEGIELPQPSIADAGKVVKVDAEGKYALDDESSGMTNPMTTADDLIVGGANGAPARLAVGAEGKILKVGSSGIEWGDAPSGGALYSHILNVSFEDPLSSQDTISFNVSVITNSNTPLTLDNYYALTKTFLVDVIANVVAGDILKIRMFKLINAGYPGAHTNVEVYDISQDVSTQLFSKQVNTVYNADLTVVDTVTEL